MNFINYRPYPNLCSTNIPKQSIPLSFLQSSSSFDFFDTRCRKAANEFLFGFTFPWRHLSVNDVKTHKSQTPNTHTEVHLLDIKQGYAGGAAIKVSSTIRNNPTTKGVANKKATKAAKMFLYFQTLVPVPVQYSTNQQIHIKLNNKQPKHITTKT